MNQIQGLLLAGRYRLGESIGKGGMGRVWRAHDEVLNRVVAVKELTAYQYAPDGERRILLARTRAEARATARVNHPNVVTIHDVLEHDDRPWIVMELVQGSSLSEVVKEKGPLEPRWAAHVGLWVLRALHAAHQAGVLHRDVKPGNVMLADDGRVLLADFGIAQVQGDATITRTGEIVGSADYLAPERVRGAAPGPACDLWALGCTLYAAVAGRSPFRRATPLGTMQAVVDEDPAPPANAGDLGPVIMSLLRKDPDDRPKAEELETKLSAIAEGRSTAVTADRPTTAIRAIPSGTQRNDGHYPTHTGPTEAQGGRPALPAGTQSYPPNAGYPAANGSATGPGTGSHRVSGPRRRNGARTALIVAAAVVLLGGGTALGVHFASGSKDSPSTSASGTTPSASASVPAKPSGALPKGWKRMHDPQGFGVAVPNSWTRRITKAGSVDYTPDSGARFLRISIDPSPDFDTPYGHQKDLSSQLQRLPDYSVKQLGANIFRDQQGSLWEFTWTATPQDIKDGMQPGPQHGIEQTYFSRKGVENVIYLAGPEADWPTLRHQFDVILRSWRPADGQ